jgi:uncharacterized protein
MSAPSPRPRRPTVAVVGASGRRSKFGNISVRAHVKAGYEVFPVNPRESEIEGLRVYRSVLDIPVALDRVTVYLPPKKGLAAMEEIAKKGTRELFLNPGADAPEVVERAQSLGLRPIQACSIVDVGFRPSELE